MNKKLLALAAGAAALAVVTGGSPLAQADPDPATDYRNYAAAGSDTTQDVWNWLANGGSVAGVASWDAFGSPTIRTKNRGPVFTRPAGSTEGIKALSAAWDPANSVYQGVSIPKQIDFARSSSGPDTTNFPGTSLVYMPFARDAVTAVVNVPMSMEPFDAQTTRADLNRIYSASTDCANIPLSATNPFKVNPKLPQSGSGTRAFFLKAIGVTTPGACVKEDQSWHENDGNVIQVDGDLIPFSAAQWGGQRNGAILPQTVSDFTYHALTIDGQTSEFTKSGWTYPGSLYCGGEGTSTVYGALDANACPFARDVYNVIPATSRSTALEELLTTSGSYTDTLRLSGFGPLTYVGMTRNYKYQGFRH